MSDAEDLVQPTESGTGERLTESSTHPASTDPPAPKRRGKRRPGRMRRFVVRPLVWGGALVIALFAGLLLFVQSPAARSRVAALVTARLSEALGRPVRLQSARIGLLPLEIEIFDLVIPGRTAAEPPFAEVPELRIQVSWRALRRRVLDLEQIEALRPIVRLDFAADGSNNLPRFGGGGGGSSRFSLTIDRVLVQKGTLILNERALPLSIDARGVWGRLTGPSPEHLAASATAQDIEVLLPDAEPYHLTLSAKGLIEPSRVTIETYRLAGPDLSAHGAGSYTWEGERNDFELGVAGEGDAALVGRLGYLAEPLTGPVTFDGRVEAGSSPWGWQADFAAPRVLYGSSTGGTNPREVTGLVAKARGDAREVAVEVEHAAYAEGEVTGKVSVDLADSGSSRPIALDLKFQKVDIARFLASEGLDLAVASRGAGTFVYRARSDDLLRGSGEISVRLAAETGGGAPKGPLPLAGDLPLRIERGVLSSPGFKLTAPALSAEGSASYDLARTTGAVTARFATGDLAGALRLIPPTGPPQAGPEVWRPTAGSGTARLDLKLTPQKTTAAIGFDLAAVSTPALAADRLTGSFTWVTDPNAPGGGRLDDLRAEARHGDSRLVASGRIPLGSPGPKGLPLSLSLEAESWSAAEVARLAAGLSAQPGEDPPWGRQFGGRLSGRVNLGGSFAAPTGRADLAIGDLALSGVPFGKAAAAVVFGGERIQIERLQITTAAGQITGSGRIDRTSGNLAFGLEAPALDLAAEPFHTLLGGDAAADLAGRGSLHATVTGTLDHPEAAITARATGLTLDGRSLANDGSGELVAHWDGEVVEAHGTLLGLATFAGGGRLDTKGAEIDLGIESASLRSLIEIGATTLQLSDLSGSLSGRVQVGADFSAGTWNAALELPRFDVQLAGHRLKNLEPIVLRLTPDRLEIASVYLSETASGSDLFATGTIGLAGASKPLDLKIQGTVAASWAELFAPGLDVAGYVDAIATVRGTLDRPAIRGEGEIRDARVLLPDLAIGLEEMSGTILFNRDHIVLDSLRARVGAGSLLASGRMSVPASGADISYNFQAIADRISLRFPAGFLSRGDAQVSIASTGEGRQISGEIKLDRAFYLDDLAVGTLELLSSAFRRERLEVEEADEFLASTALNLRVVGPGALRVRNNVADLRGDIDLSIRGNAARPVVFGAVEITEGGKLVYADNEYRVERGRVTFDNPNRIDPVIDLTAKTEVRNYDIALDLSGTLDRLTAHFRSEDGLADLDVLSLLATGRELEPGAGEIGLTSPNGSTAPGTGSSFAAEFLASQAASAVSKRVRNLFGFDRFRIDPLASGSGSISNVQLTVGKRLAKNLFVTYTTTPSASETTVLQAEWQVGKNVVILFTSNGNDRYSVDIQWETRR